MIKNDRGEAFDPVKHAVEVNPAAARVIADSADPVIAANLYKSLSVHNPDAVGVSADEYLALFVTELQGRGLLPRSYGVKMVSPAKENKALRGPKANK